MKSLTTNAELKQQYRDLDTLHEEFKREGFDCMGIIEAKRAIFTRLNQSPNWSRETMMREERLRWIFNILVAVVAGLIGGTIYILLK